MLGAVIAGRRRKYLMMNAPASAAAGHRGAAARARIAQRHPAGARGHGRGPRGRGRGRDLGPAAAACGAPARPGSWSCPWRSCCHDRPRRTAALRRVRLADLTAGRAEAPSSTVPRPRRPSSASASAPSSRQVRDRRRRGAARGQRPFRRRAAAPIGRRARAAAPSSGRELRAAREPCRATCARPSSRWPPTSSASTPPGAAAPSSGSTSRRASASAGSGARLDRVAAYVPGGARRVSLVAADERHPGPAGGRPRVRRREPGRAATARSPLPCSARPG